MARVLVVDDDHGIRLLLAHLLEALGHDVVATGDADAAVARLETEQIDVALCDIVMPGHDGLWLVDQILTRFSGVAVVILTGLKQLDARVTLRPGVVAYLTKPFDEDALAEAIQLGVRERQRTPAARRPPFAFL
jgi:CheY-like chemotaxis protein